VWTTAHTTQFAEPGWRYMDKACAKIDPATWGGSYVALRNPKTGDWSLIVCADKPTTIQVQVTGKLAKGDVHVWKSNEKIQFIEEKPLRLTNGSFTVSLEGNSVYTLSTTTGQKKGAHPAPPPAADFPLPYKDDFENYAAGVIPKYTSDQKGSFETAKRADGKGWVTPPTACSAMSAGPTTPSRPMSWSPLAGLESAADSSMASSSAPALPSIRMARGRSRRRSCWWKRSTAKSPSKNW
jgi:hypothetical protein